MSNNANTDATRVHVDAETLAAWADHGLSADAAAAVELHLSDCERCQEVLAAFVRSAPQAGAVVIPFWARRPVQWSAAGLAAAAAIVAMIWIGRPPAPQMPESTIASRDANPTASPAEIDQIAPLPQKAPVSRAPAEARKEESTSAAERRRDKQATALQDKAAANDAAAKKAEVRSGLAGAPPPPMPQPAAAPPPPPPPVAQAATPPTPIAVGGVASAVPPVGATRPAAVSENFAMDAVSAVTVMPTIEIAAPDDLSADALASRAGGAGRGGGGGGGRALSRTLGPTRWRIVAGTHVDRTINAGASWTPVRIEPELKTPLLAGSATSPLNCWLVGREGVVLVTNDGLTFRRVSVPEAVHLTAITASDGKSASVTTIDGRKFSTIDGGLTWK